MKHYALAYGSQSPDMARICRFNHEQPGEVPKLQWLVCKGGTVTWTRGKTRARFFTANRARHLAHKLGGMPAYRDTRN